MSGLSKPHRIQAARVVAVTASEIAPIDPTLELTQPGGPYPLGHALMADGMGGYVIEATLRPYLLSFKIEDGIPKGSSGWLSHQGLSTEECGPVLMFPANVIGASLVLNRKSLKSAKYRCEILKRADSSFETVCSLDLNGGARKVWTRDLAGQFVPGDELAVRIEQLKGRQKSKFDSGLLLLELED